MYLPHLSFILSDYFFAYMLSYYNKDTLFWFSWFAKWVGGRLTGKSRICFISFRWNRSPKLCSARWSQSPCTWCLSLRCWSLPWFLSLFSFHKLSLSLVQGRLIILGPYVKGNLPVWHLLVEFKLSDFLNNDHDCGKKRNCVESVCFMDVKFMIGKDFGAQSAHLNQ